MSVHIDVAGKIVNLYAVIGQKIEKMIHPRIVARRREHKTFDRVAGCLSQRRVIKFLLIVKQLLARGNCAADHAETRAEMLTNVFTVSAQAKWGLQLDTPGRRGFVENTNAPVDERQSGSLAKKIGIESFGV